MVKLSNSQIKDLTAAFVETQNQLEKTTRDKVALMAELEVARSQLDNFDVDYGKVRGETLVCLIMMQFFCGFCSITSMFAMAR